MAKYRNCLRNTSGGIFYSIIEIQLYYIEYFFKGPKPLEELIGDLDSLYYNNWDLKLLLDLLSVNTGVASSIAIIAQFDKVEYKIHLSDSNLNSSSCCITTSRQA